MKEYVMYECAQANADFKEKSKPVREVLRKLADQIEAELDTEKYSVLQIEFDFVCGQVKIWDSWDYTTSYNL